MRTLRIEKLAELKKISRNVGLVGSMMGTFGQPGRASFTKPGFYTTSDGETLYLWTDGEFYKYDPSAKSFALITPSDLTPYYLTSKDPTVPDPGGDALKRYRSRTSGGPPSPVTPSPGITSQHILKNDINDYVDVYQDRDLLRKLEKGESVFIDPAKDIVLYLNGNSANARLINANTLAPNKTTKISDLFSAGKTDSSAGSSSGPQATRTYKELKAPPNTVLEENGSDGKKYKYTILSNLSFSYIADGMNKPATVTTSYGKWNQAAENLNALYGKNSAAQATTSATTPTTTAPAAVTTAPGKNVLDKSLVQKVMAVLQKALDKPLNIKSLANEQEQIRSLNNKFGLVRLAGMIVLKVGEELKTLSSASLAEINTSTRKELAVNMGGKFASDVGAILRQVNEMYRMGNRSPESLKQLASSVTIGEAPTSNTATPAADNSADDGQVKKSSLDKKFIKAATLRRLKIRSQMEAAIDSSAQMGRARVF